MDIRSLITSKPYTILLSSVGVLLLLLLVFKAGEIVGYRKATFSYRWAENYHRNFGGPRGGLLHPEEERGFINSHGITGSIIKIDGPTIIIKGQGDREQTVHTTSTITIRRGRDPLTLTDLHVDDHIVIVGDPNTDGQIEAKFIRVF